MDRGKKAANGNNQAAAAESRSDSTATPPPRRTFPITPTPSKDRDLVKVNNSSLVELKNALDDAIKRFLSRPDLFKQIHFHTDVRLGLGWLGVLVAGATAFYSYRHEFEKSKSGIWFGLIVYMMLTLSQAVYAYFIEGDTIFVGRRKTFDRRIVTEQITLTSRTRPSTPENPPAYSLSLTYRRSAGRGKSLLNRGQVSESRPYTAFFDEEGVLDHDRFETWVGEIVGQVMEPSWQ